MRCSKKPPEPTSVACGVVLGAGVLCHPLRAARPLCGRSMSGAGAFGGGLTIASRWGGRGTASDEERKGCESECAVAAHQLQISCQQLMCASERLLERPLSPSACPSGPTRPRGSCRRVQRGGSAAASC